MISKHELLQLVHAVQINGAVEKDLVGFLRHTVRPRSAGKQEVATYYVLDDYLEYVREHGESEVILHFQRCVLD